MTEEEKGLIKSRIVTRIERTRAKVEQFEEMSAPVSPENSIGRISRMDAINNKAVYESALREAKRELGELQTAMSRIGDPDFGLCQRCKQPIDVRRLMIMPGSRFCMNCAR